MKSMFNDLKVVEFANVLAGPAVAMFFAELGAEVLKIENRSTGGDLTRSYRLATENMERDYSAYYCSTNWGKKSIFLDLRKPEDQELALEHVKTADILVSNFKKGSAKSLGLNYESVRRLNPKLIYAQIESYGEGDERPAFDVLLQAETGFLHMTGESDRPPSKMPVAMIDILAAHQLKEAVLIALLQRQQTGIGCKVSVSLFDTAIASLANQASNWLMEGHLPQRMGTLHPNIAPYGEIFYTLDKKAILLAVGTESQFRALLKVLDREEYSTHPNFSNVQSRVIHRRKLNTLLKEAIAKFRFKLLIQRLHENKVPAGPVRNLKELFQLKQARKLVLEQTEPDGRVSKRVKTAIFRMES